MPQAPFRLASVLAYREAQLDVAARDVAVQEAQLRLHREHQEQLDRSREETQRHTVARPEVVAAELHLAAEYLEALEHRAARARWEIEQAEDALTGARATLVTRHQAVSALQRLRERQRAAAREESNRRDQRALDEVASLQAERRRRE